jgi:hypothetical protein
LPVVTTEAVKQKERARTKTTMGASVGENHLFASVENAQTRSTLVTLLPLVQKVTIALPVAIWTIQNHHR